MGSVSTISASSFPKQSEHVGKRTNVVFHYDVRNQVGGMVVRDDMEKPWVTIILLDDDRIVLGSECQYELPR